MTSNLRTLRQFIIPTRLSVRCQPEYSTQEWQSEASVLCWHGMVLAEQMLLLQENVILYRFDRVIK